MLLSYINGKYFSKAIVVFFAVLLTSYLFLTKNVTPSKAMPNCSQGTTVNIVAHEDDDLLFLSPDLLHDVRAGKCVVTVFATAGDDGQDSTYWLGREDGSKAAYAFMSGVADTWTQSTVTILNHPLTSFNLDANPAVTLVFMRLPDGSLNGSGFPSTNYESLQKLWLNAISTIHAIDASTSYSRQDFIDTLTGIMNTYQPDQIHTQDYINTYSSADHSDHFTVSYFTRTAHQSYSTTHVLSSYDGYPTLNEPQNVFGTDQTDKENTFIVYGQHDGNACQSVPECDSTNYGLWLRRQYILASEGQITPTPTPFTDACRANIDGNGVVNIADFNIYRQEQGRNCRQQSCRADFDCSGIVDSTDLNILKSHFGQLCPEVTPVPCTYPTLTPTP